MLTHLIEILSCIEAAAHGAASHTHAHETGHSTGRVTGCSLHSIGSSGGHTTGHHSCIGAIGHGIFHLLNLLHILGVQGNGVQSDLLNADTTRLHPLILQSVVHGLLQLVDLGRQLGRTQFHFCQRTKGRLQSGNELGLHLLVDLVTGEGLLHITANLGVEQQGVSNDVGVDTVAADIDGTAEADTLIHDLKDNGAGSAELVAHDLLGVEVVNSLILTGVTAVGKTLTDGLEGVLQALAEAACKDGRLGRGIVCIFAGFGANLNHLALLHDDHTLTVSNSDAGTIADNVIAALGVGATTAYALGTLDHQGIHVQCLAIEKFLPLICQYAAKSAQTCFNKSHNNSPFYD